MTKLILIRHGRPSADALGTHYGQTDVGLSDRGRAQSVAVAARLADTELHAVYASDLQRACWLADRLAGPRGLAVQRVADLRERSIGVFHGMTYAEGEAAWPVEAARMKSDRGMYRPPDGEDYQDLARRVVPAVAKIVGDHPGQTVAIAGHGGPTRVLLADALGMPLEFVDRLTVDYCGVCVLDYAKGPPRVRQING